MRRKLDANQIAARAIERTVARNTDKLSINIEATWSRWSAGVGKVDTRGMALLRAAFDAGVEAALNGAKKLK
jgi:hypothetical protein